ncbi:unnamed protein product, partial [Polarella glacialis]
LSNTIWSMARLHQLSIEAAPDGFLGRTAAELARCGQLEAEEADAAALADESADHGPPSLTAAATNNSDKNSNNKNSNNSNNRNNNNDNNLASSTAAKRKLLNHQDVSNGLWALAALEPLTPASALAKLASCRVVSEPGGFRPQELANSIWALASCATGLTIARARSLANFCVSQRLAELEPMHLAAVAWALAATGLEVHGPADASLPPPPSLLVRLGDEACRRKDALGPQELANVCWALANVGAEASTWPSAALGLATRAIELLPEFKSQELVNVAWAFAELGPLRRAGFTKRTGSLLGPEGQLR